MYRVTFIDADGQATELTAAEGQSVMAVAVANGIDQILAECGGSCACGTCHCYVDEAFLDVTGRPSAMEESMLDFAENVQPNSRLSCQIRVSDDLDGLIVRLPENQH